MTSDALESRGLGSRIKVGVQRWVDGESLPAWTQSMALAAGIPVMGLSAGVAKALANPRPALEQVIQAEACGTLESITALPKGILLSERVTVAQTSQEGYGGVLYTEAKADAGAIAGLNPFKDKASDWEDQSQAIENTKRRLAEWTGGNETPVMLSSFSPNSEYARLAKEHIEKRYADDLREGKPEHLQHCGQPNWMFEQLINFMIGGEADVEITGAFARDFATKKGEVFRSVYLWIKDRTTGASRIAIFPSGDGVKRPGTSFGMDGGKAGDWCLKNYGEGLITDAQLVANEMAFVFTQLTGMDAKGCVKCDGEKVKDPVPVVVPVTAPEKAPNQEQLQVWSEEPAPEYQSADQGQPASEAEGGKDVFGVQEEMRPSAPDVLPSSEQQGQMVMYLTAGVATVAGFLILGKLISGGGQGSYSSGD